MNERIWFSVEQAADYAGCHPKTVSDACRDKSLHGAQRKKGGHWRVHRDCLDAWIAGGSCPHAEQLAERLARAG